MNDSAKADDSLSGVRVLIVEDEAAISLLLEDMLLEFGCEIAGSAARVPKAMALLDNGGIDLAILDLNVAGESSYPLAEELSKRKIGFIFSTGYGNIGIKKEFEDSVILTKPFTQRELKECLIEADRRAKAL